MFCYSPIIKSLAIILFYRFGNVGRAASGKRSLSGSNALNKNELLLHGDLLPDWFAYQVQAVTGSHKNSPSHGHLMQRQEFGFDDEIVEIGQPIGDEAVKFGAVQEPTLRDADLPDQFLIRHVAVFS